MDAALRRQVSVPRWVIANSTTGMRHPSGRGYNTQLGSDADDAARAWADRVLDAPKGPTLHPRPAAAQPKPARVWTESATDSPHDYESDDGWTLHYNAHFSAPRWVVARASTGMADPSGRGYNTQLGSDADDAARAWADRVLDDPTEPSPFTRHRGLSF